MASSSSFVHGFPFLCMDEAYPPSAKTKPKETNQCERSYPWTYTSEACTTG